MTQDEKLAARLRQILSEAGLHEIMVYVAPDKTVQFWIVRTRKVEGEQEVRRIGNMIQLEQISDKTPATC